ncbi:right-handed parallel beta-helix repeat-containing protein [Formosa sp. PL04]|uniref:right-handed parallel beta-helix repeat-containing protein n=1 Tax=Formosa sp. PL04 TaxID=3081755 RepID=UPI002980EE17|nr:right-handed parallel beta-helix repeat-containing protein [Formosa sp. PL04]MDW5288088.1 right-handed parallel beta-helix repeat-containing protein [Formosa sp. PL04]
MVIQKVRLIIICALLISNTVIGCTNEKGQGESVLFNLEIAEDATTAVLTRILLAEEKPISEIKFEKGTYHFYPDRGYEKYVHISNHNDVIIRTAFPLENFKNLTIDGQGSTFIFHGRMIPFLIDYSENIHIKNVSVDWAESFHSEGLIVANDTKNHTFDMQISDAYPYEIRNDQLYFIKEYYEHHLGQSILFDPERKAIAFNTEIYTPLGQFGKNKVSHNLDKINYKYKVDKLDPSNRIIGRENKLVIEEIAPGIVRVYNHKNQLPPVGTILVCKGEQQNNRLAPAFRVAHTFGFYATNVNVHHAGGMGLIAENSENLFLDNFNITPSNGRMVSTTADATHFVGCRGKIELKNCTFENQLDDAMNVHGTYQEVREILNENTIGVRMGHFQQQGFEIGKPNDNMGFLRLNNSFFPFGEATLKEIKIINSRYMLVTFNEKLPADLQVGDLIENLDAYPELLVENCTIRNNRARGLLLSTPKKTVVRNNFFHTEMEAILIPVESGHWYESGNGANITIEDNTFQDCQHSGFNRGVIRFVTDDDNENIAFNNITIKDNIFSQFDNLILEISNTKGLLFSNNTITNSGTFPQLNPQNPVIKVKTSNEIVLKNNKYQGKATVMVESDDEALNASF